MKALYRVYNATRSREVADRVERAESFVARAVGLLSRSGLGRGEGLWIEPCAQIHTFFMSFPIDAVFLDRDLKVLRVYEGLGPWRVSAWVRGARSVIELPSKAASGAVLAGDRLEIHGQPRDR